VPGRTLDELPPQTRRLLTPGRDVPAQCKARDIKRCDYRFSCRAARGDALKIRNSPSRSSC
jgi:hypothetical protein